MTYRYVLFFSLAGEIVNFNHVAVMDNYFITLLSIGTFLTTLQFLFLLRYNQTISIMFAVLKNSARVLLSVSLGWIIVFIAFAMPLYIFIGRTLANYHTPYKLCITLLSSSLGKFNFDDFEGWDHPLGRTFLLLYLMVIMFLVINFFITVLNDFITYLKSDESVAPKDHEVIDYLMSQLKGFIALSDDKEDKGESNISTIGCN